MAAAATATKASAASSNQKPIRPAARAHPKNSRHALEPNPFEQSFSSKPSDSASPPEDSASTAGQRRRPKDEEVAASSDDGAKQKVGDQTAPSPSSSSKGPKSGDPTVDKAAGSKSSSTAVSSSKNSSSGAATPDKRVLPSVASLTSPNQEGGSAYPWGPTSLGSLRAGPLSPAMLTGPQNHLSHLNHFDPSTFRTGFTPDLSNFKTGLTPLGSASGFPPPSPGTAAFLAMVGGAGNGPTMTPNTFNALTSHATSLMQSGDHTGITPMQSDVRNGANAGNNNGDFDLAFGKQQPPPPPSSNLAANARSKVSAGKNGAGNSAEVTQQGGAGKEGQQKVAPQNGPAQNSGAQGASGLFLLSQAHQHLSKQDQQQAAVKVQQSHPRSAPSTAHQGQPASSMSNDSSNVGKGTKRKKSGANNTGGSSDTPASGAKMAAQGGSVTGGAGKANKKAKRGSKAESPEDELDSDDEEDGSKGDGEGGSGGDDEEKRKNFLERNRQAALKCRQRKKAWLQDLQAKVSFYEAENAGLQETVGALRNEVMYLKSQLMQLSQHHQHQHPQGPGGMPLMPPGMLGPHLPQGGHLPGGVPQYGPPPPQSAGRGPSQGPSFSPQSQTA